MKMGGQIQKKEMQGEQRELKVMCSHNAAYTVWTKS